MAYATITFNKSYYYRSYGFLCMWQFPNYKKTS